MKRAFAYLAVALILSLILCGCGDNMGRGNVTASPWPDVTAPVLPTPSANVSVSPTPDYNTSQETPNLSDNSDIGMETDGDMNNSMNTITPAPTDDGR